MAEQQEEKKRKKYLLPVILLFAVCLIGAGFAYTAWTENGGNAPASEYILLTQDGAGKYQFVPDNTKVYYDTCSTGLPEKKQYSLTEGVITDLIEGEILVKLGNQFRIVTDFRNLGSITDLNCSVTSDFVYNENWHVYLVIKDSSREYGSTFIMKLSGNDDAWQVSTNSGESWSSSRIFSIYTNSGATAYDQMSVDVYYGYTPIGTTGATTFVPPDYPLGGASSGAKTLKFTVTNSSVNPGVSLAPMTLTCGNIENLDAELLGGVTGTCVFTEVADPDNVIVLGVVAGYSVPVTAHATNVGTATVKVTVTTENGDKYTASCVITVQAPTP
jgi:hypothetical protein